MTNPFRRIARAIVPFAFRRWIAQMRTIRGPIDLLGRWAVGGWRASISAGVSARLWRHIHVGRAAIIEDGTHFHTNDDGDGVRIRIGERSFIGRHCFFSSGGSITVECDVNVGAGSHLLAAGHVYSDPCARYVTAPVVSYGDMRLAPNVWIGAGTTLVGGIEVGYGTVLAAGSLVRQSLPPLCLAAGRPARLIKVYDWHHKKWLRLPEDRDLRDAAIARHLETIPSEADYVRLLAQREPDQSHP